MWDAFQKHTSIRYLYMFTISIYLGLNEKILFTTFSTILVVIYSGRLSICVQLDQFSHHVSNYVKNIVKSCNDIFHYIQYFFTFFTLT